MRKVILYIAMSLDGYIADRKGNVNWPAGQDDAGEQIDTYGAFINEVDTVVMGWNTYRQITTELSPEEWPYQGLTTYVITHRRQPSSADIRFVQEEPCSLVRRLREEQGKAIWICGGSRIIQPLVQEDLLDVYHISVIPTILGAGLPLFAEISQKIKLKLRSTQVYNGIVESVYVRR